MGQASPIQIFLAHASEDKTTVLKLYDQLKAKGYSPWLDKNSLVGGQQWREVIPQEIKRSDIVIACLSQKSVSRRGYVQQELRLALKEYAQRPPGRIYLIPLRLEPCEVPDMQLPQLGINLWDFHYIDYFKSDGFEQLLKAIEFQRGISDEFADLPALYQTLKDHLANSCWREADEETLNVMLEVAECKKQGYLSVGAIQKFPCKDLRIIDQLWVKFSNGHFGFSVQKEIYIAAGNKLDGQIDQKAYDEFGECVGWRRNISWLEYSKLTFDTSAPIGHLPLGICLCFVCDTMRLFRGNKFYHSFLISRVQNCQI